MARIARLDGRQQALDAATRLFYEQGHETVSVETVAQAAGLTKKALYYHFPTKTDLVIATLKAAQGPVLAQLCRMARLDAPSDTHPFDRILQGMHKWLKSGRFRGCMFLRAAKSYPDVPEVVAHAAQQKAATLVWLETVARDHGAANPRKLALEFRLLLDAIFATGHLYDADDLIATARGMLAEQLASAAPRRR